MIALHILTQEEGLRLRGNLSRIGDINIESRWYIIRISGFTISYSAQIRAGMYNSIDITIISFS